MRAGRSGAKTAKMPADDADDRALDELGDLLGHLGLGELDLLADEQRGALGDLLDRLAELGGRAGRRASSPPAASGPGEDEGAGERGADQDLGPVGGASGRRARGWRRRGGAAAFGPSAPMPGGDARPDTSSRLGGARRLSASLGARRPRRARARPRSASASRAPSAPCARASPCARRPPRRASLGLGGLLLARGGRRWRPARCAARRRGPRTRSRSASACAARRTAAHSGGSSPKTRR